MQPLRHAIACDISNVPIHLRINDGRLVAPRGSHLLHLLLLLLVLQLQLLHLERLLPLDGRSRVAILPRPVRLLPIPPPRLLLKFGVITVGFRILD